MVRIKRGNVAIKRRKKYLSIAKGFVGANSRLARFASEQVKQSLNLAYIGRRLKKRNFRRLWIYRVNVAARAKGNMYSRFIGGLRTLDILLDRKVLSLIAFVDLASFSLLERESGNAV